MKTHDEARQIKSQVEAKWLRQPGVTGMDVGYREVKGQKTQEPAIRVYVSDKSKVKGLKLPKTIKGVHVQVIERRFKLQ